MERQTTITDIESVGLAAAAVAGLVAATGLARGSLGELGGLVPVISVAAAVAAGVAAHLLTVLARVQHRPVLRWVAAGQLAAAAAMLVEVAGSQVLAPGGGILGTSAAGDAWLHAVRALAVPLTVLAGLAAVDRRLRWPTVAGISVVAVLGVWNARFAAPAAFTPDLRYTSGLRVTLVTVALVAFTAVALWYRSTGRRPCAVEAWIGVSLTLHALHVALHALAGERLTPLWWAAFGTHGAAHIVLVGGLLAHVRWMLCRADAYGHQPDRTSLAAEQRTDPLTGMLNRPGLLAEADALLAELGCPAVVVVVDLEGFREINERDGHESGDRLLRSVSSALGSLTRRGDLVGRWDGDEFVVVFPVADPSVSDMLVERISTGINRVTPASVGHAVLRPREPGGLRAALARADVVLYTVKNGRQHTRRCEAPLADIH